MGWMNSIKLLLMGSIRLLLMNSIRLLLMNSRKISRWMISIERMLNDSKRQGSSLKSVIKRSGR